MRKKHSWLTIIFVIQLLMIILIWNYLISPITIIRKFTDVLPDEIELQKVAEIESLKYELFRDLMMSLVAFLAVIGPALYLVLSRGVEKGVAEIAEETKNLMELKQNLYWCTQTENQEDKEKIIKNLIRKKSIDYSTDIPIWLDELINRSRKALSFADTLDRMKHDQGICIAKNNLAYYLAVRRNQSDKQEAKKIAQEVFEKSKGITGWYHHFDTYVWVLWCFADNGKEQEKARQIFNEIYAQKDSISDRHFKQKIEEYKLFFNSDSV